MELTGKTVCRGIAIGKIKMYSKNENQILRNKIADTEAEIRRYEDAKEKALKELEALFEKAVIEVGEDNAEIFNVHAMMLDDEDYNDSVVNIITGQQVCAEYAVATTGDNFSEMFAGMDDEYFKARSVDVKDISERLIRVMNGGQESNILGEEPVILMAEDIAPSETVQMDKTKLLSFVTRLGSANSHTAILARTMGIPALVGVDIDQKYEGKLAIVDGYEGKFIVDPDREVLTAYTEKKQQDDEKKKLLQQLRGKENVTKSGKKINLYANIGSYGDLAAVIENDAGGIGLFRSEFLYLENSDFPTEEEQFAVYRKVVETMGGKKVIIRTLDIGADKQCNYFHMEHEENPALGCRAIRICLTRPEIFKTQLRALYRASVYGNLSIMFPMIISVKEVRKIKEIIEEVKAELREEGLPFKEDVELGIMIETPASVMMSRELAKEVDFFSVGTNDLTQYTLAIDRQNLALDEFYDPHHPAVLAMIKMAADNAHAEGKWIGICGELGADLELTEEFLKMGLDELSVSPAMVLPLRKKIRECE